MFASLVSCLFGCLLLMLCDDNDYAEGSRERWGGNQEEGSRRS